ncbi:ankyrin repeat domain-containing protein [Candidatus Dependentiae bacterium]|nr:ankyrin repeat domain-containing protein [Candidatus Dependentiae bacterium]
MKYVLLFLASFACSLNGMSSRDLFNQQLLHALSDRKDLTQLEQLLQAGFDVNASITEHGHTPLIVTVAHRNIDAAKLLLKAGAYVDTTHNSGSTALHDAAHRCSLQFVELLLAAGANVNAINNYGDTAFHTVVRSLLNRDKDSFFDVVTLLLEAGANVSDVYNNRSMRLGIAYCKRKPNMIRLFKHYKQLQSMIKINPRGALDKAIEFKYSALVKQALQKVRLTSAELVHYNHCLQTLYGQSGNFIYKIIGRVFIEYALNHAHLKRILTDVAPKHQVSISTKIYTLLAQLFSQSSQDYNQVATNSTITLPQDIVELITTYAQK